MELSEIIGRLKQIDETESSDGEWIGNLPTDVMDELFKCGLVWRTGTDNEYLQLTQRGDELLELARKAEA